MGAGRKRDRKSTRLNSSHLGISYAVFCLKKKNKKKTQQHQQQFSVTSLRQLAHSACSGAPSRSSSSAALCSSHLFTFCLFFFFFNDTATTEIYTLSLHDALPISIGSSPCVPESNDRPAESA